MRQRFWLTGSLVVMMAISPAALRADEAPITGTVKAVDSAGNILAVQAMAKGKPREVAIHVRPDTKIVRFVRGAEGKGGFDEQTAALADIKPGWTVTVTTVHEGDKEVARLIRIVHEK